MNMSIVRLCGNSLTDFYALVTQEEWEIGMPQAIVHWDGATWRWIRRYDRGCLICIRILSDHLYVLDRNGWIEYRSPLGDLTNFKAPYYGGLIDPNSKTLAKLPPFGYRSLAPESSHDVAVVGEGGAFFRFCEGVWSRIDTQTIENLYDIRSITTNNLICGTKGTLLRFDGIQCRHLDNTIVTNLTQIDGGLDGSVFVGGNALIQVDWRHDWRCRTIATPTPLYSLAVVSQQELYASTVHGVLHWEGQQFQLSVGPEASITQMARLGETVIGAGYGGVVYFGPPHWQRLPAIPDEGYL